MKYILLASLTSCFSACVSSRQLIRKEENKGTIVYIFPTSVSKLIDSKIRKSDSIFMFLNEDSTSINISLETISYKEDLYPYIVKTNRKVLIKRRLIPLLLGSDQTFAVKQNSEEILALSKKEKYPLYTQILVCDDLLYIAFDHQGNILKVTR